MWMFIAVGVIPFVIVFGIVVFNTIRAIISHNKTKEAIYDYATSALEKVDAAGKICAYCGTHFKEDVCPACGAGVTKK